MMLDAAFDPLAAARALADARCTGRTLSAFPGRTPASLDEAYACQRAGVVLSGKHVAGWKVARIAPEWAARLGAERLVGPVLAGTIKAARATGCDEFCVADAHYAAVEAEVVVRVGRDAPPDVGRQLERAADLVDAAFLGVELAASALEAPDRLGPLAVIADGGINAGLLLGDPVRPWRAGLQSRHCDTFVEGRLVGSAEIDAEKVEAAFRHALVAAESAGLPLRRGQYVSTGAQTGVHPLRPGETAEVRYRLHKPIVVARRSAVSLTQ